MTALSSLARAIAVDQGIAQPIATVRHVHISDRPLVLIPLALAGEANAPLAAMAGTDRDAPALLVVHQPRNRDQRFAFAARLAQIVLGYVDGYRLPAGPQESAADPAGRWADAPQVIVPNTAGIAFVRLFGRSTRFRRAIGEHAVDPAVPVLGRWLTFLTERSQHPGSCLLLAATQALSLHWATGQSPVEDLNLAALLGWIDPPPGTTGRDAALAAENPVISPPAGPATDPTFDNEVLEPLIAACGRRDISDALRRRSESALEAALARQLTPTWALVWRAVDLLRALPAGARVATRWNADKNALASYAGHLQDGGPPQPRRDSAVAAARKLNWLEHNLASYAAQRALDDPLVMADYRLTGEAFAGQVISAEPDRLDTSGRRRKLRPRITVRTQDMVRVEPGTEVFSPARPGQKARVVSVRAVQADHAWRAPDGSQPHQPAARDPLSRPLTEVTLELSGGMGRALTPAPGSVPAVGEQPCYTTLTDSYQPTGAFPAREDTPWTHGGPPPEYVPADADAAEEWS